MTWQQPPQAQPYGQYGAPVVLDAAGAAGPKIIIGSAVAGVIGLIAVISAISGAVDGGTGVAIAAGVIGAIFLLIGLLPWLTYNKTFRPRKLIVEPGGVRWDDPKGAPWAVPWQELGAVAISTGQKVSRGGGIITTTTLVRLDLWPRDPGFMQRHPEMRHLWESSGAKGCYRLPLGPNAKFITPLDAGLRAYAPPTLYRGVADEGIAWGMRYT